MLQWYERNRDEIRLWRRLIGLVLGIAGLSLVTGFIAFKAGSFWYWPLGLAFAIIVAHFACRYFLQALRYDYMGFDPERPRGIPPSLVGVIEQLVFVFAVGAFYKDPQALAGVFAIMALWLGAKMLTGWNRADPIVIWYQGERDLEQEEADRQQQQQRQDQRARGAFSALLAGVLSLAIATVGGNIAAGGAVVSGGATVFTEAAEWILGADDGVNPKRYYPANDIAL